MFSGSRIRTGLLLLIISLIFTGCAGSAFDSSGYGLSGKDGTDELSDIAPFDAGNDKTKIVFTTGFRNDEVFRINDSSCYLPEVLVYLTNIQNSYEETFGKEIWDVVSRDGTTLEDSIKENALSRIARVKTMVLMAGSLGLSPDADQLAYADKAAEEYYDSLSDYERSLLGVDLDLIRSMCRDYVTAEVLYAYLINDINPEISDDEARTVKIDTIFVDSDEPGSYEIISNILSSINNGTEFDSAALENGKAVQQVYSINKTDEEEILDEKVSGKAFNMSEGETSGILEADGGYYIIKCLSTLDREETDENKEKIVRNKRREAFGREYDNYTKDLTRRLNERLWDNLDLIHDPGCSTSSFFKVLDEHLGEDD